MATHVFFNPGTGAVPDATSEQAQPNMPQLLIDAGYPDATFLRCPDDDYGDGRYCFIVYRNERQCEVQMPGLPLENVRYLGREDQNIWHFPRLYIDGASWVWLYAKNQIGYAFEPESESE